MGWFWKILSCLRNNVTSSLDFRPLFAVLPVVSFWWQKPGSFKPPGYAHIGMIVSVRVWLLRHMSVCRIFRAFSSSNKNTRGKWRAGVYRSDGKEWNWVARVRNLSAISRCWDSQRLSSTLNARTTCLQGFFQFYLRDRSTCIKFGRESKTALFDCVVNKYNAWRLTPKTALFDRVVNK